MKPNNVVHINSFIQAAIDVLSKMANIESKPGEIKYLSHLYSSFDIMCLIGVNGDFEGVVALGIDNDNATYIAAKMLAEDPSDVTYSDTIEAMRELGNIIVGNALIELSENGVSCNLTPPTLVESSRHPLHLSGVSNMTIVPLLADMTDFELSLSLRLSSEQD